MKNCIKFFNLITSNKTVTPFKKIGTSYLKLISTLVIVFTVIYAIPAFAAQYYVGQRVEISMRRGPGISYKVITMLPSGEGLTMMEYGKEWSRVQTADGKDGWVLSRYITKDIPDIVMLTELQTKNSELTTVVEQLKAENTALSDTKMKLVEKEKEYNALKERSANFLEIEDKYHTAVKQLEEQKVLIDKCNSQSHKEILYSFSIGAGVLIIGIILGMSAKKKQRHSLI